MTRRNSSGASRVRGHGGADAGVVDQHVDPAELVDRLCDDAVAVVGVGDVGLDRDAAPAERLHLRPRLFELLDPARADRDVRTRLGQAGGERDAQARRSAGDDRDLSGERERVEDAAHSARGL